MRSRTPHTFQDSRQTTAWVRDQFGVELHTGHSELGWELADLVGVALRRNPRRAHLLVSSVLGKHIPADPRVIRGSGLLLGALVGHTLAGSEIPTSLKTAATRALSGSDPDSLIQLLGEPAKIAPELTVLGFAETATGLGHCVAEALGAGVYLHSTRRAVPGVPVAGTFEEGHSHATSHLLEPIPGDLLAGAGVLVLVDDEFSTGKTVMGTIAEIHQMFPREHYVIASLIDLRSATDVASMGRFAAGLGVRITVVSLVNGRVDLPEGLAAAAAARIAEADDCVRSPATTRGDLIEVRMSWPAAVPDGGRHGFLATDNAAFDQALEAGAQQILDLLPVAASRILVIGTEELMYLPLRLAQVLGERGGREIRFQTTTRSPVHPVDATGYPVRRGLTFISPEGDTEVPRYLYNADWDGTPAEAIVVVVDAAMDTRELRAEGGLTAALMDLGVPVLLTVVAGADALALGQSRQIRDAKTLIAEDLAGAAADLPEPLYGPAFGSYRADEVSWLLKDLSELDLEADVAEREQKIQTGKAHYAESLPIEFQPDRKYQELFEQVLAGSAARLAQAVGLITELVLAERGSDIVLVSLARAGTPVGILMKRWAAQSHGLNLPHYAVSIVRGRGIDRVALQYLAQHHDPASIVFVDGWTGKGAIARELTEALTQLAAEGGPVFNPALAVLADPGSCVMDYGTRDDFLIASACLNSTVSGLVSRTVLNDAYIGPRDFHGAKFYADLAGGDRSHQFLDAVSSEFDGVRPTVLAQLPVLLASDRTPTWAGWAAVERISEKYGIESVNFVKPGVGETTRVLLRRIPWRILVRDADALDHQHIRLLAAQRDVPVEVIPDLPYACVGLIRTLPSDPEGNG